MGTTTMDREETRWRLPKALNRGAEFLATKVDAVVPRLPPGVDPGNFVLACMAEANGLQRECSPASVAMSALNAAVIGLVPGAALGHCYFIPFKSRCTLVIGYRGFLDLALGHGFLTSVHADVILAGEPWKHWKDEMGPRMSHKVPLDRDLRRENVMGAYCSYQTRGGGHGVRVVGRKELDKVDTGKDVWRSDYCAMAMKTPIRRASKEWLLTPRLAMAVQLDEQAERGEYQACDAVFDDDDHRDEAISLRDDEPSPAAIDETMYADTASASESEGGAE